MRTYKRQTHSKSILSNRFVCFSRSWCTVRDHVCVCVQKWLMVGNWMKTLVIPFGFCVQCEMLCKPSQRRSKRMRDKYYCEFNVSMFQWYQKCFIPMRDKRRTRCAVRVAEEYAASMSDHLSCAECNKMLLFSVPFICCWTYSRQFRICVLLKSGVSVYIR